MTAFALQKFVNNVYCATVHGNNLFIKESALNSKFLFFYKKKFKELLLF